MCKPLYTDTNSLLLEIKTNEIYKDIESNKNLYDTSDYPKEHPLYSNANKQVLDKMKDEPAGTTIAECVSETENVLLLEGRRKKYQKSEEYKREC